MKYKFYLSKDNGFSPVQIIIFGFVGIAIVGGIIGGVVYYEKPAKQNVVQQSRCGDGVCGPVEKANPNLCPKDCVLGDSGNDIKNISDIKYSSIDSDAVKLDLYFPDRKICLGKFPLVIMIHGGAFKGGDKKPVKTDYLINKCYAVASVNYRLSSEAKFPAGNQDVKSAVRWLRANSKKYNLDSDHFGVLGESAGGYYSSFLGTTGDVKDFDIGDNLEYSSAVQAVVDKYGLVNISTLAQDRVISGLTSQPVESEYIGCDISASTCTNATKASPVNYISNGDAPFFILHGDKDDRIPIKQSKDFYELLNSNGIPANFTIVPGAGHGGVQFQKYESQIAEFFDKYLK